MSWLCIKLSSSLFGNTRDMFVMHEKANFVCFIYMQPQKMKFKSVQINMKQVSYIWLRKRQFDCEYALLSGALIYIIIIHYFTITRS